MSDPGNCDFDPGLEIHLAGDRLDFTYGPDVLGPQPELRRLDAIRPSLLDPQSTGPDPVYAIAMDVCYPKDRAALEKRYLLFGVVAYASGAIGREPVRSQGHVHAISPHSGWSAPELFEIWEGKAIVYAQELAGDNPGKCFAVEAGVGEHVVVPPGWVHCVINADPQRRMVFGALCDRQYGFVYDGVRAHRGVAWFPVIENGGIEWQANPAYAKSSLLLQKARSYEELNVRREVPIYRQFEQEPDALQWVSDPARVSDVWRAFEP